MPRPPLTIEERRTIAASLIHAAQQIISSEGLANVTLRKVSKLAKVNTAILYRHFSDLDELLLFACIDLLKDITIQYEALQKCPDTDKLEHYLAEWRQFCQLAFQYPKCFNHVFFGRHSHRLDAILREYTELFADELTTASLTLEKLQWCGNLSASHKKTLANVLDANVSEATTDWLNDVIISYFRQLVLKKLEDPDCGTSEALAEKMVYTCNTLIHWANNN